MAVLAKITLVLIVNCALLVQVAQSAVITAIVNVNVVDVKSGTIVTDQTMLIDGKMITMLGHSSEIKIPENSEIIDGTGKYITPGFWDMHMHTSSDSISREVILPLMVTNGVTGIRSMAADCHLPDDVCEGNNATIDQLNNWRAEIADGTLIGPKIIAGSYYINDYMTGPGTGQISTIYQPGNSEDGRALVHLLASRGVDFIKIYDQVSKEAFLAIADEANKVGLPFAGHIPFSVRVSDVIKSGIQSIEHLGGFLEQCSTLEDEIRDRASDIENFDDFWSVQMQLIASFDEAKCAELYADIVKHDTWLTPTLMTYAFSEQLLHPRSDWKDDPLLKYVPRDEVALWRYLENEYFGEFENYKVEVAPFFNKGFEITEAAHKAGVKLLVGSDAGEYGIFWGFSFHDEMQLMVDIGMSEAQVLRAATFDAAKFSAKDDRYGTVESGKIADLVLLDANPLADISNTRKIHSVILDGKLLNREKLDQLLLNVQEVIENE